MLTKSAILALGAVSAAVASPLHRRQENITTGVDGVTTSLAAATDTASVQSSVTMALSSAASSAAMNTTAAAAPTSTGATAGNSTTYTGCPTGYALTYAVGVNSYPAIPITQAYDALMDWGTAIPPPIMAVSNMGSGIGATRMWMVQNISVSEVLVNVTMNDTTGYLDQAWNLSAPVTVSPSLIISNATTDLTLYANTTTNETTVQFFVNFCASEQASGIALYGELVAGYLNGLNTLFVNATSGANSTSASTSAGAVATATDSASSAASGVTDSAAGAASTGVSGATDVAGTVTSGAAGAASTAISGASGAAGTAASAITGGLDTAISGASSVVGDITSALIPTRRA